MAMAEQTVKDRYCYWKHGTGQNPQVDAFLAEVIEVGKRHGMSISHEDGGGAFIVCKFNSRDTEWLLNAHDETDGPV